MFQNSPLLYLYQSVSKLPSFSCFPPIISETPGRAPSLTQLQPQMSAMISSQPQMAQTSRFATAASLGPIMGMDMTINPSCTMSPACK